MYEEAKEAHRTFLEIETPELIKEVNRLIDKKSSIESKIKDLVSEREKLEANIESLRIEQKRADNTLQSTVKDTENKQKEYDQLVETVAEVTSGLQGREQRLEQLNIIVPDIERKLRATEERLILLQSEVHINESKNNSVKAELEENRNKMNTFEEAQKRYETDLKSLEILRNDANAIVQDKDAKIALLEANERGVPFVIRGLQKVMDSKGFKIKLIDEIQKL